MRPHQEAVRQGLFAHLYHLHQLENYSEVWDLLMISQWMKDGAHI